MIQIQGKMYDSFVCPFLYKTVIPPQKKSFKSSRLDRLESSKIYVVTIKYNRELTEKIR